MEIVNLVGGVQAPPPTPKNHLERGELFSVFV